MISKTNVSSSAREASCGLPDLLVAIAIVDVDVKGDCAGRHSDFFLMPVVSHRAAWLDDVVAEWI